MRVLRAFAIVLLVCACEPRSITFPTPTPTGTGTATATASPSSSARPTAKPTLRPLASTALTSRLLSYERGGDVGRPAMRLLLLADGRVISEDPSGELFERRLTPSGAASLLLQAISTGYFEKDATYQREPLPGTTPPAHGATSIFFVVANGARDVHVGTIPTGQPDDNLYQPSPVRDKLSALARGFEDLSWVPTTSWADATPRTYLAAFHRLFVQPLPNLSSPPGAPSDVDQLWPFTPAPEVIGDPVPSAPAWRCAVLDLEDARLFGDTLAPRAITRYSPGLRTVSVSLPWRAGSGLIDLQLTPLFPHEPPTCVGAQP